MQAALCEVDAFSRAEPRSLFYSCPAQAQIFRSRPRLTITNVSALYQDVNTHFATEAFLSSPNALYTVPCGILVTVRTDMNLSAVSHAATGNACQGFEVGLKAKTQQHHCIRSGRGQEGSPWRGWRGNRVGTRDEGQPRSCSQSSGQLQNVNFL